MSVENDLVTPIKHLSPGGPFTDCAESLTG